MIKVLFVCHGNICRSPMAEFVLKDMVAALGIAEKFTIASAATSSEEIGNPPHPGAIKQLAAAGIGMEGKRAVQIKRADYDRYDYLIGMDHYNIHNMHRVFGGDPDGRIFMMLAFAHDDRDISDPWYTGDFESTYRDVREGCVALLNYLGYDTGALGED